MSDTRPRGAYFNTRSNAQHFSGPAKAAKIRRGPNNVCGRKGCGHFRSQHKHSLQCSICGESCLQMVWEQ